MIFRVGQKVVCIDDQQRDFGFSWRRPFLKRGEVYIVRWHGEYFRVEDGNTYEGVRLVGLIRDGEDDTPWAANRFRPVV